MKKLLVVGVIVLFLGMSISSSGFNLEQQSTVDVITVDDEGDGDYTSIKEALNNSNPSDTIEVYSGIYYEQDIIISKEGITLIGISHELGVGNDTDKPFIYGNSSDVLEIMADGVTIKNFCIDNTGERFHSIITLSGADNCLIANNTLMNTSSNGITCIHSDESQFIYNNISHVLVGIYTENSQVTISKNIINDSRDGIYIRWSLYNSISSNKITNCRRYAIYFQGSLFNMVSNNHIENNRHAIYLEEFSGHNVFNKNNFINNTADVKLYSYIFFGNNQWINNYWSNWSGIRPKVIQGQLIILAIPIFFLGLLQIPIRWFNFDWHPASEPYDIEV